LTAYDPSQWSDLFVATAGASAALAGLLFVAVSVNVDRILSVKGLPERGLETIVLLLGVLLVSIVALIPGQDQVALGIELLILGLTLGAFVGRLPTVSQAAAVPSSWIVARWAMRALAVVPLILGGLTVLAEAGGGLYWVVAAIVFAIVAAVANAWVLLIEILR
jgi:modulator of FtsH protease